MNDQPPRYYTAIDLFWDIVQTSFIAVGCYCGLKLSNHFWWLFAGGIAGRVLFVGSLLTLRSYFQRWSLPHVDEPLDGATKHSLVQLLGSAMSDISKECLHLGWGSGTELYVPELCWRAIRTGTPQKLGGAAITPEQARGLWYLAEWIGCWAKPNDSSVGYVPFQPYPIPADVLAAIDLEQTKA